ncbi:MULTISPECIES: leucine-rich repeat domain-containing protein [unclassified Lentimonas]|uniref:leucine-rich repeat domain-containing protein n=1 Tax=unclassified Lentimonas TaxID=2630993 RepID=UPI001325935A|nr:MULTISPECIES: leucine-rich repeat domain-containing protein [unclassified Lentimonas]CAA6678129.1 Chitin binding protein [Lentimonas sp. CC4]CAA6685982.1 Chitin binding protein [Lentimonas sp. CC6]CAA7075929.1 Chitin binding protein [Lentimonas sp. CC4]CAA7168644.1 Chitin binding protein [Lentimonas sp. CC21]CAA7181035.1 Chitin binding protein [Lentimonas sp. CC8]
MKHLLLSIFIICSLQVSSNAADVSDLTYVIDEDSITITDCYAYASGELVIPETIESMPVTSIGDSAFEYCRRLTSVTIPESVISIGDSAFDNCENLTSVTIPVNVNNIGDSAFQDCSNLTSIDVHSSNQYYSSIDGALLDKSQRTLIKYPSKKTGAFTVPNSVTRINDRAFYRCSYLNSITISDSITRIGSSVFTNCDNLISIDVDLDNRYYSSIAGVLFNKRQTTLIHYPARKTGAFTIPTSVTDIADYAFYHCSYLSSITIPDGVISLGWAPFAGCTSLISVTIPDSVTSLDGSAFSFCSNLTNVIIGSGVTIIRGSAFNNCSSLTNVTIGSSVTSIGGSAFRYCTSLISVTIPASVTSISYSAFSHCSNLTSVIFDGDASVSLPSSVFSNNATAFKVYFYEDASWLTTPTWKGYASETLALNEDSDGDQVPNKLERVLGTNPLHKDSNFKSWHSHGNESMRMHYSPPNEHCQFAIESTTDLSDPESWQVDESLTFSADPSEPTVDLPVDGTESVFYRMRISAIE